MNLQNNAKCLLAAESGGSKTVLCLLRKNGELIGRMETNGIAAAKDGLLPVTQTLDEGINRLCRENGISLKQISYCYFSLGGPNQKEVESALKNCLPSAKIIVGREADGNLIMTCVPYFNCTAAIMAGTGTVAVGEFKGERYFSGGWGPEFDDAGGGGKIGKDALVVFLQALDRRRTPTSLSEIFKSLLSSDIDLNTFSGRMKLKQKIHAFDRKKLASHAPEVYGHFKRGDAAATEIIIRASKDIATLAAAVIPEKTGLERIGILCLGGIFKLGEEFRNMCSVYLKEIRPECELVFRDDFDLAKGACLMVLKISGSNIDHVGIGAEHSFEDAIVPRIEARKKYGKRVALLGGV